MSCVFCELIEVEDWLGPVANFEPLKPVTRGHRLFIPTRHLQDAGEDPMETGRVMAVAAQWAEENLYSYNLITSRGVSATQSIEHLHIHVIPRRQGDGLHLPWDHPRKLVRS